MELNKIYPGDCLDTIKTFPDQSVQCVVTSPPYWGLRDYGVKGQMGLEKSPEEYINDMVKLFQEIKRVLRDDGTIWVNLGDSYWGGKGQSGHADDKYQNLRVSQGASFNSPASHIGGRGKTRPSGGKHNDIKPKDLIGIPWMFAFALRNDGWFLRSDIIWHKPNPMPESVVDRPTKSHEYIFLFSKSSKYFYDSDAIREPLKESSIIRLSEDVENQIGSNRAHAGAKSNGNMKAVCKGSFHDHKDDLVQGQRIKEKMNHPLGANKRTVWTMATMPFKEAHFATFPEDLIKPCILAGCPPQGVILDPFMGAGTTALVANKLNRQFVGCELNPEYIKIAQKRIKEEVAQQKFL